MIATRDRRTNLIPEHINWAGFDGDGGSWDGKTLGVLPSASAWVDPGNLYSMGTAIRVITFILDSGMGGSASDITLRIPDSINTLSASNVQTPSGYVDILYRRAKNSLEIFISGDGDGVLRILLDEKRTPHVSRDGEEYPHVSLVDSPPALEITTDFSAHSFLVSFGK